MTPIVALLSILAAQVLGAISPGPSFLFVTRTSVAVSREDGLAAAAGMGLGAAIITAFALLGVRVVIAQVEWLYIGFKLLGGAYLLYLAFYPLVAVGCWRLTRDRIGSFNRSLGLDTRTQAGIAGGDLFSAGLNLGGRSLDARHDP